MTKSIDSQAENTTSKSPRQPFWLWVLIFRLFLLGLGASFAIFLGFLGAIFYPRQNPEQPFIVKLWLKLPPSIRSVGNSGNASPVDGAENPSSSLTEQQKQQLQVQMEQLEAQLQQLEDQAQGLGTTLEETPQGQSIKSRLEALGKQFELPLGENPDSASSTPGENLKVTLPSDILFADDSSTLSKTSNSILNSIVTDLKSHQGQTIVIGAHTDIHPQKDINDQLSFQRAKAIENYLANALGENYRLLAVGYGSHRPLADNDTEVNRQLNRRVEIFVNQ